MDLDTNVKGFVLTPQNLEKIFNEITSIATEESFEFAFGGTEEIRKNDDYSGYRVKLVATFDKIKENVFIDVTTGDVITHREVEFGFGRLFNEEKIELLSYPLETIFAEKLETILSRGVGTTRPRDFYDVYILKKLKWNQINFDTLKKAVENTKRKRKSVFQLSEYDVILNEIKNSEFQQSLWKKYQKQYTYAAHIPFEDTCDAAVALMNQLEF